MTRWEVERIVHFDPADVCKDGFVHFGFHDRKGRQYAIAHQRHFLGLVGEHDALEWTVASEKVFRDVPNIRAELQFPIYLDSMPDGTLLVSNFGNARIHRIDPAAMEATLFADGRRFGMKDAGNCVVDDRGLVWVNEVMGCRVWTFDPTGHPVRTLGDGTPGFQRGTVDFDEARFHWIYDIRRGPEGTIYVLDSRNFALRVIDPIHRRVSTLAGTGRAGYEGDGGPARLATFGSNPSAKFDGPISLSLDEGGNVFVGDRQNRVVRMLEKRTGTITTIAGDRTARGEGRNAPEERDPSRVNLPMISSMDYHRGRLFVPTDLADGSGDLIVLRKA